LFTRFNLFVEFTPSWGNFSAGVAAPSTWDPFNNFFSIFCYKLVILLVAGKLFQPNLNFNGFISEVLLKEMPQYS
jgi:hypothetical protein